MKAERSFKNKPQVKAKLKYEDMPRLARDEALEHHAEAIAQGARCEDCPMFGLKQGPVMDVFVPNARLIILAETPTVNDVDQGAPFTGESGTACFNALLDAGLAREECDVIHTCMCRTPEEQRIFEHRLKLTHELACAKADEEDRPHPKAPLTPASCCAPRLKTSLDKSLESSNVVLSLGQSSLKAIADYNGVPCGTSRKVKAGQLRISSLKKQLGAPITMPSKKVVVPTYHPNFAMRPGSKHYKHVISDHIKRAAAIVLRGGFVDWSEPEYILNPSVETIEAVLGRMVDAGTLVSMDIETDQGTRLDGNFDPWSCRIRCIGFGSVLDGEEVIICVPIRYMNGVDWWTPEEKRRVIYACKQVLNNNPLVGHNLAFDTSVLLRYKLLLDRQAQFDCTMLMQRNTIDCDLPKDLGFTTSRNFETPSWKSGADDKFYDGVTDADLHLYNARDVLTVLRLYPVLQEQIYRYGTSSQYEMDRQVILVARDMGDVGLWVDEEMRGRLSIQMNGFSYELLLKLKDIVGDPEFNPNSPPQVRKFLFAKKKLRPEMGPKGKDWEEGEDPSTGVQALLKLISKQACDEQTKLFINTLLEYRQYMKLKSTYIDNIRVSYPDFKKEYGLDIPRVPAVYGKTFVEYKKREKIAIAKERWPRKILELATKFEGRKKDFNKALSQLADNVEKGEWREALILPERPAFSVMHATYKLHVVSSGRWASSPNLQNIPERGKVNMRAMYVAPPGHVFVGADMDQVELRLYACIAGDLLLIKAFNEGMDPHSYNAASMFAKKFDMSLDQTYEWIIGLPQMYGSAFVAAAIENTKKRGKVPSISALSNEQATLLAQLFEDGVKIPEVEKRTGLNAKLLEVYKKGFEQGAKEKKKLRGYAKTFCIAEGQLVLTQRGEIPIEHVQLTDKLWDGVEWVSHRGVICRGVKDVITYDNLTATPDHKVYLENGETCTLWDARERFAKLLRTHPSGNELRLMDRTSTAFSERKVLSRFGQVFKMLNGKGRRLSIATERLINRLSVLRRNQALRAQDASVAAVTRQLCTSALHKSKSSIMEKLWRARNRVSIQIFGGGRALYSRTFRFRKRFGIGQNRQQWTLRAWESALGHRTHSSFQSKERKASRRLDLSRRGMALLQSLRSKTFISENDSSRHSRASARDCSVEKTKLGTSRKEAVVYDILNAGPRRCFTVAERKVSNCYLELFGGGEETLFALMSTARDKATGELMFPDLTEADVAEWHEQWHLHHPWTKRWQQTCERNATQEGYIATSFGCFRKRYLPGGLNKSGASSNHTTQGGGGEIANDAIVKINKQVPKGSWSVFTGPCSQVHDYIGWFVPEERADEMKKIIETAICREVFGMKITAKAKVSRTWDKQ